MYQLKVWITRESFSEKRLRRRETHRIYLERRLKDDPDFKLIHNMRSRVRLALKGDIKHSSCADLLGCSVTAARKHIESQFADGMSWNNHGDWHIDHIKPCSSFNLKLDSEQRACFHYSNLQPLWAKDNLQKGNRIEPLFL